MARLSSSALRATLAGVLAIGLGHAADAAEPAISIEISREWLSIPHVQFGGRYDESLDPSPLVGALQQDDGNLAGARIDLGLRGLVPLSGGPDILVSVKGFYAAHRNTSNTSCQTTSIEAACDGTSLFDPSPTGNNSLGTIDPLGEVVTYATDRQVTHWGASIELPMGRLPILGAGLEYRLGLGYRAIDQKLTLSSLYDLSGFIQDHRETLTTGYLGGYVGVDGWHPASVSPWTRRPACIGPIPTIARA